MVGFVFASVIGSGAVVVRSAGLGFQRVAGLGFRKFRVYAATYRCIGLKDSGFRHGSAG